MAAETGKPGTNWKQVTPANRKKVSPLVRHYMGKAHPFTACVRDNTKRFGPERAKRICAVVKDMGEKTTKWRKGGKVSEAPLDVDAYVEAVFDAEWAPVLEAEGVTVDELADWAQMATDVGVLESVEVDVEELPAVAGRVLEATKKPPLSNAKRRSGESLTDYGKRLQAGDASNERAAERAKKAKSTSSKTRSGASSDFEKQHPRGRGGSWTVKVGGQDVHVQEHSDGNLRAKSNTDAIKRFQQKHGLKVDGIIGKQTASALLGNKSASKVKAGKIHDDQKARLRGNRGRVRQAADTRDAYTVEFDALMARFGGVSFEPDELVEACRSSS